MDEQTKWLTEEWIRNFSAAVESMTGESLRASWEGPAAGMDPASQPDSPMWWLQSFNLGSDAGLAVGTPKKSWLSVGTRSLRMAGIDEVEDADARSTYLEIVQQAMAGLSRSLSARLGREVNCESGRQPPTNPGMPLIASIEIALQDENLPAVVLACSPQLLGALTHPAESPPVPKEASLVAPSKRPPREGQANIAGSKTLDLLLEVELPVSVSFGRAKLPLKDVVKLTTGSIVELNRTVVEPVEIIVNNCVIARGEVVVIEGNYGVRINQIISREERLRTLN